MAYTARRRIIRPLLLLATRFVIPSRSGRANMPLAKSTGDRGVGGFARTFRRDVELDFDAASGGGDGSGLPRRWHSQPPPSDG